MIRFEKLVSGVRRGDGRSYVTAYRVWDGERSLGEVHLFVAQIGRVGRMAHGGRYRYAKPPRKWVAYDPSGVKVKDWCNTRREAVEALS